MMPRKDYSEIMRNSFDGNGERRPKSNDPFSSELCPAYSDGDYPQWLQKDLDLYLPRQVLEQFATQEHTMLNGMFWEIPAKNEEQMIDALKKHGYSVAKAQHLNFW
jgi:hypothetical protein